MAFTVDAPTLNEKLPKTVLYTIQWTDGDDRFPYNVDLYKGGVFVESITIGETNKEYDYTPGVGLTTGDDYTVKVTDNMSNEADSAAFTLFTLTQRVLSDTVTVGDGIGTNKATARALSDTISVLDAIVRTYSWARSLSDRVFVRDYMIVNYITTSYNHAVYHVDFDAWTQFSYIDELRSCVLTGGSLTENINLILTNTGVVNKYPGDNVTSQDANFVSKIYDLRMGVLRKIWVDFTGSPSIKTRVYNEDYASPYYKDNTISSFFKRTWRWIANGYNRGNSFELHITNADIIKNAVIDVSIIGRG